jgi:inositol-phosphate transport system permease protein
MTKTSKLNFFNKHSKGIFNFFAYTILIIVTIPIIIAYLWLIMRSFSTDMNGFIPVSLTLANWSFLWKSNSNIGLPNIWIVTLNTLLLAIGVAAINLFLASISGFAFSRFNFKGNKSLLLLLLLLHAFPTIALMVSIFYILNAIHLLNTLWGVILLTSSMDLPWDIWIIKGFYDSIPAELEWAGVVDGYSRISVWWKVLIPNIKHGLFVIGIFEFLAGWSQFIFVTTFIFSNNYWTLSQYVYTALGDYRFANYGLLTAISVWYIIPVALLFSLAGKYLTQMSLGGVKG